MVFAYSHNITIVALFICNYNKANHKESGEGQAL